MTVETEMCPGHVGRGTGTHCCMCTRPIPEHLRRTADSPPSTRPGCIGCQRGQAHVH